MRQIVTAIALGSILAVASLGVTGTVARPATLPNCGNGQIVNNGTLTLKNCIVSDNTTGSDGGGIDNSGTLKLMNVTIKGNTSSFEGGGIYNEGTLTGTNVTITQNTASNGDGGGIYNDGGTLTLTNSTITQNTADNGNGGGIYASRGTVTLHGVNDGQNTASNGDGGGIYVDGGTLTITGTTNHSAISVVSENTASNGDGGGIYDFNGNIQIIDSMIQKNSADDGAGIYINGQVELARHQHVILGTEVGMQDSSILQNTASGDGGGIYLTTNASVCCGTLDGSNQYSGNLTIAGNSAASEGGGIYNGGGKVDLEFSTVSDNSAPTGAGIADGLGNGQNEFRANLFARNSPSNCGNLGTSLLDDGYNLDTGTTCGFNSWPVNKVGNSKVKLSKLEKVGHFLWGEQLAAGSPAIDAVPLSFCVTELSSPQLPSDEFDTPRPQGNACDIGAAEWVNWKK